MLAQQGVSVYVEVGPTQDTAGAMPPPLDYAMFDCGMGCLANYIAAGIPYQRMNKIFLAHLHADHIHGIDDLRIFSLRRRGPLSTYVASEYIEELESRFPYIFDPSVRLNPETSVPRIDLRTFEAGERIEPAGIELYPLAFPHGHVNAYGFRAGPLGVVVDGKQIPNEAKRVLLKAAS